MHKYAHLMHICQAIISYMLGFFNTDNPGYSLYGRNISYKKDENRKCRLVFYWSPSFKIRSIRVTITTKTL